MNNSAMYNRQPKLLCCPSWIKRGILTTRLRVLSLFGIFSWLPLVRGYLSKLVFLPIIQKWNSNRDLFRLMAVIKNTNYTWDILYMCICVCVYVYVCVRYTKVFWKFLWMCYTGCGRITCRVRWSLMRK